MSGIVGILNLDGAPIDPDLLARMTNYMAFRGPDNLDNWSDGPVGFGHTLLRTTFESENEGGVSTLDNQVFITADVRLDGRDELADKVRSRGRQVSGDATDVDLVLHAYHLWGRSALEHILGDFAFAIWDGRCRELFCAHDHFGVVPFYYARVKNCLVFSNTLNAVRLHPAVSDKLNDQALGDFLLCGMNMELDTTTFTDVKRLPPAHSLSVAEGKLQVRPYFRLPTEQEYVRYKRPQDYIEHFRVLFEQAMADRLRTDRVGTALSGGMDSPSIAVTAHKILQSRGRPFDLRTYTIIYEDLIHDDEGHFAGLVADKMGSATEYLVAEDYLKAEPAQQSTYLLPEPLFIPSQVAECDIATRVASFSRTMLGGFGADPLLNPVPTYDYWCRLLKTRQWDLLFQDLWRYVKAGRIPPLGLRSRLRGLVRKEEPLVTIPDWIQPELAARAGLQTRSIAPRRDRKSSAWPLRHDERSPLVEYLCLV